jgi:vacuolar-type H+-ATPase subunit I/STV1
MSRGTGTGFLGFGIALLIVGALMRYAVTATTEGFSINTAGVILLWAGVVAFVIGLIVMLMGSQRRSMSQSSIQHTPTGEVRTEERIDSERTPIA